MKNKIDILLYTSPLGIIRRVFCSLCACLVHCFAFNIDVAYFNNKQNCIVLKGGLPIINGIYNPDLLINLILKNQSVDMFWRSRGHRFSLIRKKIILKKFIKFHIISVCQRGDILPMLDFCNVDFFQSQKNFISPYFSTQEIDYYSIPLNINPTKPLIEAGVDATSKYAIEHLFHNKKAKSYIQLDDIADLINKIMTTPQAKGGINIIYVHCLHGLARSITGIAGFMIKYSDQPLEKIIHRLFKGSPYGKGHTEYTLTSYNAYIRGD